MLGFFLQDSWSVNRLTLNLGVRYDKYDGILPAQSAPASRFAPARTVAETDAINQNIAVWRTGLVLRRHGQGLARR